LRHTRWPDQVAGIGWGQGTELKWLQRLVSHWANEFDWRLGSASSMRSTNSLGTASTSCTSAPHPP
jgi:hypothetical protein